MTTGRGPHDPAEVAEDLGEDGVALLAAASVDDLRRLLLSFGPRRTTCVDAELLLHAHHTNARYPDMSTSTLSRWRP